MLLLTPVLTLALGLLALVGLPRWRPAFKAYWLVAVAACSLAALLVLVLRVGLPRSVAFAGWHLGEGLDFPFALSLDAYSWPLALAAMTLVLASLLGSVRRAPQAAWLTWLPSMALAAAALLVVAAADLLAFALTLFLYDLLALILAAQPAADLRYLVRRFAFGLLSIGLVLLAWAAPPSYATFASLMLLLALVLRLGVAVRLWKAVDQPAELNRPLRLTSLSIALALLAQVASGALPEALLAAVLLVLLLVSLWSAARAFAAPVADSWPYLSGAWAAVALAAAVAAAPAAALSFGLLALFAPSLPGLLGAYPRARLPLLVACALALSGLPLTPLNGANALLAAPASPLAYALLLPWALALAGVMRALLSERSAISPDERWTRGVETTGVVLPSAVFALLGLGLAPRLSEVPPPFWPGLLALILAIGVVVFVQRRIALLPPHVKLPQITSGGLVRGGRSVWVALQAVLAFISALLEGEAGLLWAMLFIALLISIVAQSGFAGS